MWLVGCIFGVRSSHDPFILLVCDLYHSLSQSWQSSLRTAVVTDDLVTTSRWWRTYARTRLVCHWERERGSGWRVEGEGEGYYGRCMKLVLRWPKVVLKVSSLVKLD